MLTELVKVTIESHPSHFISCNLAYLQHKLSTGWTNYSRWLITSCQLGCFSHPPFTLAHTGVLDRGEARARDARASRPPSAPRLTWLLSMLTNHFLFLPNIILVLKFWLSNRTEQYKYWFFWICLPKVSFWTQISIYPDFFPKIIIF